MRTWGAACCAPTKKRNAEYAVETDVDLPSEKVTGSQDDRFHAFMQSLGLFTAAIGGNNLADKIVLSELADWEIRAMLRCAAIPQIEEMLMKRPVMMLVPLLLGMSGLVPSTFAQTNPNPVSSALRDILPGRQKNTVAAVEAMPADKFNYKPTPDQMSFGHLVAHMIESNYLFCGKVSGVSAPKTEEVTDSDPKEKLVAALQSSFAFCSESLGKLEDAKLGETTEGFGGKTVTRGWFSLVLASSWADHYAEASMYLRLNGVLPPTAKK